MLPHFEEISDERILTTGTKLGQSREGRDVVGYRIGHGSTKISLIAGCHADEPVGPILLARLVAFLQELPEDSEILSEFQWWVVPHVNPDGAEQNRRWAATRNNAFDAASYLQFAVRELPGDDVEFGFPARPDDTGARPENLALFNWWRSDEEPFSVHVSLHGMAFAGGPWFLIDPAWSRRSDSLMKRCREETHALGYRLHDVERHGEKGFVRIERGFATRPNSKAMRDYFKEIGDPATAGKFRPSSMETIRSLGGDALTLVSEVPLFVLPGVGEQIAPTDPVADVWRRRFQEWATAMDEKSRADVEREIDASALRPMPITDQMRLQWAFICAGIEQAQTARCDAKSAD